MLTHRSHRLLTTLGVLAVAAAAMAAVPEFWRLESQGDFLSGDTDGVSIASDGTLSLAPSVQLLSEATDPHYWSLALGSSGEAYVGSGNEGRVYRIGADGATTTLLDTDEIQVHALAVDRQGNVYAGTSPRGMVYRIRPDGSNDVIFDPDDRYIWALAVDSRNNVLVATGDKARIYRVSQAGESEVLFESQESHIVSLAVDDSDNVYAGTDSNGLVLHVDPSGATRVLYDSTFQEVRAVVTDTSGNVFIATVNGGSRAQNGAATAPTPQESTPSTPTATVTTTTSVTVTTTAAPLVSSGASSGGGGAASGAVYRIGSDGAADELWRSQRDTPLSLSLARDDRLMVGTGNDGRVYLVQQNKSSSLLLSVEADQVTDVHVASDGQAFLSTSNPAKLFRLNRGRRTEGTYRSATKDTETMSSWGRIRWEARTPTGTNVALQTRSGNSAEPDNTWSDWSSPYTTADGEQVSSPRGRFFQWRAILSSTGETTPELLNVTAVYLQQNLAPEVTEIRIHPAGQTFQKPIVTTGQMEILGMDDALDDGSRAIGANGAGGAGAMAPPMNLAAMSRPMYNKGIQTVTWTASDPNRDELSFEVHYRAESETLWRTLRSDVSEPVIAWDTVAMPDGRYTLRVVASDSPGNPADIARTGERTSHSFEVDNTPPSVEGLAVTPEAGGHRVRFVARDALSPIRAVEYAVNSGPWNLVFPVDGIADSPEESFDFALEGYGDGGVYTLVVKLTDGLNNAGTARAELR